MKCTWYGKMGVVSSNRQSTSYWILVALRLHNFKLRIERTLSFQITLSFRRKMAFLGPPWLKTKYWAFYLTDRTLFKTSIVARPGGRFILWHEYRGFFFPIKSLTLPRRTFQNYLCLHALFSKLFRNTKRIIRILKPSFNASFEVNICVYISRSKILKRSP